MLSWEETILLLWMIDIVPDSLEIVYIEDMCFFLFFKEYLFSFVNETVA